MVRHPPTFDQPPVFDQQAFAEAIGVAAAAIAQASIAGSQGGPSNLQRFRAHHPPTFTGGGDPMVADHWFMQIENVLEAMEITSDTTMIRLDAFQLEGEAQVWWRWARTSRDLEVMTWAEFQELFMGKYFPETARHAKAQEFLEMKQGAMTVMDMSEFDVILVMDWLTAYRVVIDYERRRVTAYTQDGTRVVF